MASESIGNFRERLRCMLEQELAFDRVIALLQKSIAAKSQPHEK